MNEERWEAVQACFDQLVELDATDRADRLATLAIRDRELHRAVESLLQADAGAEARLASLDAALRLAVGHYPLAASRRGIRTRLFPALADRYRIEREIGSGGMATVYLARDLKHDRDVALKVLRPDLGAMLGSEGFLNEIKISARLDHPHILTLIDSGAVEGFVYYVMPFVRGESLRDKLRRQRQLRLDEALDITRQIASALDYAHRQGVVHRDIKPENVLLHEGEAMLTDFGIATAVEEAAGTRFTESGVSPGTPRYMSPEQATGDRVVDSRSDVYSLAVVLYEMLAGEPPHTGASAKEVIPKLLAETPRRLREVRDTVPEGVDAAVSKALAKRPADRYANAGDFARALAIPPSAAARRSRRWTTVAIGGGVATAAAIVAAFSQTRKSTPTPAPDRVQLTVTGNAVAPSLSPDRTRVAFGEKQCDAGGACTFQLVLQNTDGSGRLVVTRNIGYIYKSQWTRDGRFVEFAGSHPPLRHGAFAVSTLGGETRFLGCCFFDLMAGDTALLHMGSLPGADRSWVKRITVHDGHAFDSIPVRDTSAAYYAAALTIPDRILVAIGKTSQNLPELRLTDFRGRVVNRITPPFGSLGRHYGPRWVPLRGKLVIAAQRELGGTEFDILAMDISASGIKPDVDTVLTGVQLGNGIFDVSPDGEQLIYFAGSVETSLTTIDVDGGRTPSSRLPATQVLSSTTRLRGRMSPAGDRIILARDASRGGAHASQFSVIARDGGAESQLPVAVENLLDFEWSPGGRGVMYLHGIGGNKVRLTETDTAGRGSREIARFEQTVAAHFFPLADGAVGIMPAERRSISITRRPGKRDVTWHVPNWISEFGTISPSRDAKTLAVAGINRSFDSVVVGTMEIETGRFTRIGTIAGSDSQDIEWLDDGSMMLVFREPPGAFALYRIARGKTPTRIGGLPYTEAAFSLSSDGNHVAAFGYSDKSDVFMIRNFGKMLRPD